MSAEGDNSPKVLACTVIGGRDQDERGRTRYREYYKGEILVKLSVFHDRRGVVLTLAFSLSALS